MKKFTLIELLIVMAIIGILLSLLLPSLTKAKESARRAVCMSNQSQIYKGMQVSVKLEAGKVPIGTHASFRYAMPLWDVNRLGYATDGWMPFGQIYKNNELTAIDVWDCPSRKTDDYWQRPMENRWPPGENPNQFTQSAYAMRASDAWKWINYEPIKVPFLSQIQSDLTYMSDQFVGSEIYLDRHGISKTNIFTRLEGSTRQTKSLTFHTFAIGNGVYNTIENDTVIKMWKVLDEL